MLLYARSFWARPATLLIIALALMASTAIGQPASFELRTGVVVEPGTGLAYVMSPEGGIDALRIDTGLLQWHSDAAAKPLGVSGGALIAQTENNRPGLLELVLIDTTNGRSQRNVNVDLPPGVAPRVTEGLRTSFVASARGERNGFDISWDFEQRKAQGFRQAPGASTRPVRASGSFRIEPGNGAVTRVTTSSTEGARPRASQSATPRLERVTARQFPSVNGESILASERVGNDSQWQKYLWTIYGREGQELGSFRSHTSFAPFLVADSTVLFETRRFERRVGETMTAEEARIRAVSLSNGVEQWSWPIRDLSYRGPFPP